MNVQPFSKLSIWLDYADITYFLYFMINIANINSSMRRRIRMVFGKPCNISKKHSEVICSREVKTVSVAVHDRRQLERVIGTHEKTELSHEMAVVNNNTVTHAATVMYSVGKVKIRPGIINLPYPEYIWRRSANGEISERHEFESGVISISELGGEYFGHWLRDDLTSSLIGNVDRPFISTTRPAYLHGNGYAKLLDSDIVCSNNADVSQLWMLQDFSQNSFKVERYKILRSLMAQKLRPVSSSFSGVYLRRGLSGAHRLLSNENTLIEYLKSINFDILNPEDMSAEALVRRLWNTSIVIAVEGSSINHALYPMSLQGSLLVLQPPSRFNNVHKGICDAIGRRYGFYVCKADSDGTFLVDNFRILYELIDRLS